MIPIPVRVAAAAPLVLLVLGGCSFRGSASESATSSAPRGGTAASSGAATSPTSGGSDTSGGSGSSGTSSSVAPTPAGSSATAGGTARCHTSQLAGSLVPGGAGAGQRYATVVLRNNGSQPCTVTGYGGLGLAAANGQPIPTRQVRVSTPAPSTVRLPPGGTASATLHWGAVPGTGDAQSGDCQPVAATLRVIPPDETDPLTIPWTGGPVCEAGTIAQQAYAG